MRALSAVAFSALLLGCFALVGNAQAPASGPSAAAPTGSDGGVAAPSAVPAGPPAATVKITIFTVPSARKTFVHWGKKKLGVIEPKHPLIVQRPRDSGPLDLIITSEGYFKVQTRAYTFADTKLAVKLTPIDQKNTLLGYREELPPEPDAGAPPPPGAPPPGPAAAPGGLPSTIAAPPRAPQPSPPRAPDAGAR